MSLSISLKTHLNFNKMTLKNTSKNQLINFLRFTTKLFTAKCIIYQILRFCHKTDECFRNVKVKYATT